MAEQRPAQTSADPDRSPAQREPAVAGAPAPPPVAARGDAAAEAELAELRQRVAQLEDQWKRALADLDNLRKRMARESQQQRADERARVAALWLPVIDNLEL